MPQKNAKKNGKIVDIHRMSIYNNKYKRAVRQKIVEIAEFPCVIKSIFQRRREIETFYERGESKWNY